MASTAWVVILVMDRVDSSAKCLISGRPFALPSLRKTRSAARPGLVLLDTEEIWAVLHGNRPGDAAASERSISSAGRLRIDQRKRVEEGVVGEVRVWMFLANVGQDLGIGRLSARAADCMARSWL